MPSNSAAKRCRRLALGDDQHLRLAVHDVAGSQQLGRAVDDGGHHLGRAAQGRQPLLTLDAVLQDDDGRVRPTQAVEPGGRGVGLV